MRTEHFRRFPRVAVVLFSIAMATGTRIARAEDGSPALPFIWSHVSNQDGAMSEPQGPVPAEKVKRWAELFASILGQFQTDQRDAVANIEGDFSTLELRLRVSRNAGWVSHTLTDQELESVDLKKLAKKLYAAARAAGEIGV